MNQPERKKRQAGFTLVEILVVIVIVSLLATLVGTNVIGSLTQSEDDAAKLQVLNFKEAVDTYRIREGRFPETLDELIEPNEKGTVYLNGISKIPTDPWGSEYVIRMDDETRSAEVVCVGRDKEIDTEDDISSKTAKDK